MSEPQMHLSHAPQQAGQLAGSDMLAQHALIQDAIAKVMIPGHHYGVIPGTEARAGEKPRPPVLLKPGAEKLCVLFRLSPTFDVHTKDLPNGHREERVTCTLTHIPTGVVVASAIGSCSTMEAKYRYRNGKPKCPECGAETILKSKKDAEFFCWQKKGGCGATFPLQDKRIADQAIGLTENRDLADVFNTVLKMAVKRAHIAATLLATAASDAFVLEEDAPEDGDDDDDKPPKQTGKKQQATKQRLMAECFAMQAELLKSGRTKEGLIDLIGSQGIVMAPKWGDMTEQDLEAVKKAFGEELKLGTPVKP